MSGRTLVLDSVQVNQKIKRIAYQLAERNFGEKEVVLMGIDGQGFLLAEQLAQQLGTIAPFSTVLRRLTIDKSATVQPPIAIDADLKTLRKKSIVLVDDVLNTGRTLAFSLQPLLTLEVKKIEVAVLVNRSHSQYPIQPTYTGFELTTTLDDHVAVTLGQEASVYLVS